MQPDQFLIAARDPDKQDALLNQVIQEIAAMQDAHIVKMTTGVGTKRLVATLSPEAVSRLEERFGEDLIVEVDAQLKL